VAKTNGASGKVAGANLVLNDITERKNADETLRESDQRYRALFDRSLDAVYIHDLKGNFLDANDAALRLLGSSGDEVSTLSFADLLDEAQLPSAFATLQEIMTTGSQAKLTVYQLRRKDGTLIEVETLGSLITEDGQPVAIQGIARDITERRRAEAALRTANEELEGRAAERIAELEQKNTELRQEMAERVRGEAALKEVEQKFRQLAENVAEVFWLLDPKDYQVLYVSPAYEELWGRTCESLYEDPRSWLAVIHPADLGRVS